MDGCDMIVNLFQLPEFKLTSGVKIKRAFAGDKEAILKFVKDTFQSTWVYEAEAAIMQRTCFIATMNGKICGFACFDVTAKGYFGPIGVLPEMREKEIGKALLLTTLETMKAVGYGYGIIGWVGDAEHFYRKCVNAEFIKNGEPNKSVYSNLIEME